MTLCLYRFWSLITKESRRTDQPIPISPLDPSLPAGSTNRAELPTSRALLPILSTHAIQLTLLASLSLDNPLIYQPIVGLPIARLTLHLLSHSSWTSTTIVDPDQPLQAKRSPLPLVILDPFNLITRTTTPHEPQPIELTLTFSLSTSYTIPYFHYPIEQMTASLYTLSSLSNSLSL